MFKKMFITVLLVTALIFNCTLAYAEPSARRSAVNDPSIMEITNNIDGTKTFDKSYALCIRAEEGTIITFSQLWFKSGEEKSIVSKRKNDSNSSGEWVLLAEADEWKVGASGLYAKSITWKTGRNRIKLNAKSKDGKTEELIINIELVDKKQLNDLINSFILKNIGDN